MSVGGVAFAVLLILVVLSLYRGWGEVGALYSEFPGEVWVTERATPDPFHSNSLLSTDLGATLNGVPDVDAVIPVYARHVAFRSTRYDLNVFTLALDVRSGVNIDPDRRARFLPPAGQIVVDRVLADAAGVSVGEELELLGRPLVVSRITSGGNRIFETAFVNAADARSLFGNPAR